MSGLNGKLKVYSDPIFPSDQSNKLIGIKGGSVLDTGYVYSPYIPMYKQAGEFEFPGRPPEPSIVDRVATLDDPTSDTAKRVADYDSWETRRQEAFEKWLVEREKSKLGQPTTNLPPMIDPNDFSLRKGLRTRSVKLAANPDFFGKVNSAELK